MTQKRIVIAVLAIAALLAGFRYRIYAENWYWHFRHGEVLAIDEYRVPVPKNWFVQEDGENGRLLLRLDTVDSGNPKQDRKGRFRAFVGVWVNNTLFTSEKLERLTSIEASTIRQRGHEPALRDFEFDGEKLSCLGGETFSQMLASARPSATPPPQFYEKDPNVWNCKSSGRINLQLSGTDADMPQIWEIVSGIRKGS